MSAVQGFVYRPDIDALRAFAVVPVVLFHLGASWLPGGFLGVDVFFVISGYLITSLLVRELPSGAIDLFAFWRRRILRILPALLVMVVMTFVAGHVLLYAPERYMLAVNSAGALLSFGNITHWRNYGGYWSADATDSPLLHTWSLGVEEQFYVLYPIILFFAWRLLRDRTQWLLVAGLIAGGMLYAVASKRHPGAAFYLFPTRAWELLAGAVAAWVNCKRVPSAAVGAVMSIAGLLLILLTYAVATETYQAPGAFAAVLGSALVVGSGSSAAFARIGLTARIFVIVGLISYSVYLWHWPLIVLGKAVEVRQQLEFWPSLYVLASLGLGWLSWRFIETPIRRDRRHWVPLALIGSAIILGITFYSLRNVNGIEPTPHLLAARWDGERFNVNPAVTWPDSVKQRMRGIEVSPRPEGGGDIHRNGVEHRYGTHAGLDILVLGDSHGLMWAPAIDISARELGLNVRYMTADGTPIFFDPAAPEAMRDGIFFSRKQWTEFNRARSQMLQLERPPVVAIGGAWNSSTVPVAAPLLREIAQGGGKVLLVEDAPDFAIGDRNAPSYMAYLGIQPNAQGRGYSSLSDLARAADEREAIKLLADVCASACKIISTRDLYEDGDSKLLVIDQQTPVFIDDDHLSVSGALLAAPRFKAALQNSLRGRGL
ncbi:acyltransferase family protein [Luteimonas sp. MJ204]|uniref:acyltransferase family protein n=1 Tax=Luteimonas sp. MJ145 TaxID=3129234 RepID=UPI0031BB605F